MTSPRSVIFITVALFLGIGALVLHLLAIYTPHWKKTVRVVEPAMPSVLYGIWERCELMNTTLMKQGIALGVQHDIKMCRPNVYMRYSRENFDLCNPYHRKCPVINENFPLPEGCHCRYLPTTRGLQWLTFLGALFLILGLLILYLKIIATPRNDSGILVLNYGPALCFLLTLSLLITGLILFLTTIRRDAYEDYSFPLTSIEGHPNVSQSFDLGSLRNYAKHSESTLNREQYEQAETELFEKVDSHFHTEIGRAVYYEIIAMVFIFLVTLLAFYIGIKSRSDDI